jgi:hypothetical protein
MSRYFAMLLVAAATGLFAIACINCIVDVTGVYHPAQRSRVAADFVAALRAAPGGLVFLPYERSVKLALLRSTDADCYVTGASQQMQLTLDNFAPAHASCRRLVNITVSAATFEDLLTHIGELADHAGLRRLYVGVGPWMLRRGADARWTEERIALQHACRRLGLDASRYRLALTDRLKLLHNAINSDYLWRNLQSLHDREALIVPAAQARDADRVMLPDGSFWYSRLYLLAHTPRQESEGDGSYKIAQPYVSPAVLEELGAALSVLTRRGVQVVFLLAPYHPSVMRCRQPQVCEALTAVTAAVRQLASGIDAQVLGSYDPALSGLGWRDFYDDMHISADALDRMSWPSAPVPSALTP